MRAAMTTSPNQPHGFCVALPAQIVNESDCPRVGFAKEVTAMMPVFSNRRGIGYLALVLSLHASTAHAQCNDQTAWDNYVSTSATMGGAGGQYVAITARTQEPPGDPCNSSLQSEAWLNPGGTPAQRQGTGTVDATASWSGNFWGTWTGTTKHWYIYNGGSVWHFKGSLDRSI